MFWGTWMNRDVHGGTLASQVNQSDRNPDEEITDGFDGRTIITTHLISIHLISTRLQYWFNFFDLRILSNPTIELNHLCFLSFIAVIDFSVFELSYCILMINPLHLFPVFILVKIWLGQSLDQVLFISIKY